MNNNAGALSHLPRTRPMQVALALLVAVTITAAYPMGRYGREYFEGTVFEYTDGALIVSYGARVTRVSMSARV